MVSCRHQRDFSCWAIPSSSGPKETCSYAPEAQRLEGIAAHIVGNWNVSGIWSMYTGAYFGPSLATSVSNSLGSNPAVNFIERPNRAGDGNLPSGQRTIDHWFDTPAFRIPQQFTFGNSGLLILQGPGYFNLDTSIHRDFRINEQMRSKRGRRCAEQRKRRADRFGDGRSNQCFVPGPEHADETGVRFLSTGRGGKSGNRHRRNVQGVFPPYESRTLGWVSNTAS
jgi:hypothetical protein